MPDSHALPDLLLEKARGWEKAWGLPGLLDSVTVEFSTRMWVSLGLCRPVRQWRCAACRDAGLPGKLVIAKLPPADQGSGAKGWTLMAMGRLVEPA